MAHSLPYHVQVHCDECGTAVAKVWYMAAPSHDAMALCGPHAWAFHEDLEEAGYAIIRDHRPQTREELRAVLLSPAPPLSQVLETEALRHKFHSS